MKQANMNLRLEAKGAGIPFWRIAKKLGISEPTLTRWMREELKKDMQKKIRAIIAELKEGA